MRFASLGSGSSGNATLISAGGTHLLVDCGFGVRETERRLAQFSILPEAIDAVLITHEHSDHIKGVGAFSRRYKTPVYMTHGTWIARDYGDIPNLHIIEEYEPFRLAAMNVHPVAVPHDAREPAQYIFDFNGCRLGVLTDLGYITPHIVSAYKQCNALLLEANHCTEMLAYGQYPPSLKTRVGGNWGHLNNRQTAEFLSSVDLSQLTSLVIGHISQQNNSVERVVESLSSLREELNHLDIIYACQDQGFGWQKVSNNFGQAPTALAI